MSMHKHLVHLIVLISFNGAFSVSNDCIIDGKDLSLLNWPKWDAAVQKEEAMYNLSICAPMSDSNCNNSYACRSNATHSESVVPYNKEDALSVTNTTRSGMFWLYMEGKKCKGQRNKKIIIHFKCGPTLGSPDFMMRAGCDTYFTWQSIVACKKPTSARKQVPCYVYDSNHRKRDLSPLIKLSGHYQIKTVFPRTEFWINVCSGIISDPVKDNSSAVFLIDDAIYSFGKPSSPLQINEDGRLQLFYDSDPSAKLPEGCTDRPQTTIIFVCPKRDMGENRPKLLSLENCNYVIEWETEYACPVDILEGDTETCSFNQTIHGVELSLAALTKSEGTFYEVKANVNNSNVTFLMNVCGALDGAECDGKVWKSNAVCLHKDNGDTVLVGRSSEETLRYSDGALTLTYAGGSNCSSDDNTPLKTVITFTCDTTVKGDAGPSFSKFEDCIYFFNWPTLYACVRKPQICSLVEGNTVIDLKILTKPAAADKPWVAIQSLAMENNSSDNILLNVCGPVPNDAIKKGCHHSSSVCLIGKNDTKNLGSEVKSLNYNNVTGEVTIDYVEGEKCDATNNYKVTITFICKTGSITSPPVLTRKSANGCHFQFVWHTAAACVQGTYMGSDCKVSNEKLGINFDLTLLQKQTGYQVTHDEYDYYINVCKELKNSFCTSIGPMSSCQTEKAGRSWNLGHPNSSLVYEDGFLFLKYFNGSKYSNGRPRSTHISFLCDTEAGIGKPEFVNEQEDSYIFDWFTSQACPKPPIECIAVDPATSHHYDLSQINGVWPIEFQKNGTLRKIYLSVCKELSVAEVPIDCDSQASACLTEITNGKETVIGKNIGRFIEPPTFESEERLTLKYTSNETCVEYGIIKKVTTSIHFICAERDLDGSPGLATVFGDCHYMFIWPTSAACPVKELDHKELCTLIDPINEYSYNLKELTKSNFYLVESEDTKFQLNICGKATSSGCNLQDKDASVCMEATGRDPITLGRLSTMKLEISMEGIINVVYTGPGDSKVIIRLRCEVELENGQPVFIRKDDDSHTYIFEMKTPFACGPVSVDCQISDIHGNQYDLTPLIRKEYSNWMVKDMRDDHLSETYHINVCRPLVSGTSFECPGGPVGVCQTSSTKSSDVGSNLGFIRSSPEVLDNGTVTLKYSGGSWCGNRQFRKSTKVLFICSHIPKNPVLISETSNCEYIFAWETPAGCPLQRQVGKNCAVTDPLFGYHFDLNDLYKSTKDYEISAPGHKYFLNVCGPLVALDGNCKNAGVCQIGDNNINAGNPSTDLLFDDGQLVLTYTGGKNNCHKKYERKSVISFMCDHSNRDDGPMFVNEADDCKYFFEWRTRKACPPYTETGCTVLDSEGKGYDLSSLSLLDDNRYVTTPDMPNVKFIINVCRTIVPKKGARCPYDAGSCLVNLTETNPSLRFQNLGKVGSYTFPKFDDKGKLMLKYEHGDICRQSVDGKIEFKKTEIEFVCQMDVVASEPEFLNEDKAKCIYSFVWRTQAACPIAPDQKVNDHCSTTNPKTGFKFDLSSLKNINGYTVETSKGHKFVLNVCDKLPSSNPCGSRSGSCQEEVIGNGFWNAGNYNANLRYHDGTLTLTYTNGAKCHQGMFERNTTLQFVCGDSENTKPVFISETDDCTYFFMWHTKLACETQINCEAPNGPDGKSVDLSALVKSSSDQGFHRALSLLNNNAYYVNLCRPLNPVPGVLCPPGSSICQDTGSGPPLSLGKASIHPFYDFTENLVAIFSNGSTCPDDSSKLISSKIIFKCKHSELSSRPILIDITNCIYTFEWETMQACTNEKPEAAGECIYRDKRRDITIDLSVLKKTYGSYEVKEPNTKSVYNLNICGRVHGFPNTSCQDSAICFKENDNSFTSLGNFAKRTFEFVHQNNRLKLKYSGGERCPESVSGTKSTEIEFYCNAAGGQGQPKLTNSFSCLTVFEWGTNLLCGISKEECFITKDNDTYDLSLLSSISHNWHITDINDKYWLNVCGGIYNSPNALYCPPSAGACYQSKHGNIHMIGIAKSQELSITENGDIQLVYTGGTQGLCRKGRTDNNFSSTKILFHCSNITGRPQIISQGAPNDCTFTFHWNTSLACPQKRIFLVEKHGILFVPNSNLYLNFTSVMYGNYVAHELFRDEKHKLTNYTYLISMNSSHPNTSAAKCKNAAVCQTNEGFQRNVGSLSNKQFIIKGSELQLLITSAESKCGRKPQSNVTTRIIFSCSSVQENPKFLFESNSCDYIFRWYTPAACIDAADMDRIINPKSPGDGPTDGAHTGGSSVMVIVVSVITVIMLILLLVAIFYKKERRSALCTSMKRCCRSTSVPIFHYSKHSSQRNEEDGLLVDATLLYTDRTDNDSELLV